jgi:hypothetical protein
MADYYPLIAKAVTGLDKSTGEARRALYERARNALVTQLRGVSPSLSEQDITRERLALEEAIRKVEAEAARKSRFDPPPERKRVGGDMGDPFRPAAPPAPSRAPPPAPPEEPNEAPPPAAEHDDEHPESPLSGTAADLRRPVRAPPPPAERAPPSSGDGGLKGFRHVVADAENLGDATAQASRSAREAYNAMPSPSPEFDRLEPRLEPEGLRARDRRMPREQRREPPQAAPPRQAPPPPRDLAQRDPRAVPPRDRTAARVPPRERPPAPPPHHNPDDFDLAPRVDPRANDYGRDFAPTHDFDDERADAHRQEFDFDTAPPARQRPGRRHVNVLPDDTQAPQPTRGRGRFVAYAAVAAVVLLIAGVIAWQWEPMVGKLRGLILPTRIATPTTQPSAPPTRPKINDRIGSNDAAGPQTAADVAQRVVLYEEDPDDQAGKRFVGSAVWRTEQVSPGAGQPPETVVRADIDIPERKITMKWSLQRNADRTLPASHTIQVMFTLPPDFPHQGIQNVPGVLMKEAEQTRGVPLAGSAVKVMDGYFLIGLSATDTEMQRNISLLKERPWFDVPIVYTDGRRAILAVEKGTPGERAFRDAFTAWRQ